MTETVTKCDACKNVLPGYWQYGNRWTLSNCGLGTICFTGSQPYGGHHESHDFCDLKCLAKWLEAKGVK